MNAGAVKVGFAKSGEVDESQKEAMRICLEQHHHADMEFMSRHAPLKENPDRLLPGCRTVISMAFSYYPSQWRNPDLPIISSTFYGKEYSFFTKKILREVAHKLQEEFGGQWMVKLDNVPVAERYWAIKAGLGRHGLNGSVIVDGYGGMCTLAEVLTTLEIDPDAPNKEKCLQCGACIKACPGKAIGPNGAIDARKCLGYLSYDYEGEWNVEQLEVMNTRAGKRTLFGCDICQRVCPHNKGVPATEYEVFQPMEKIMRVTSEDIMAMDDDSFNEFFMDSPIKDSGLEMMRRNARHTLEP